MYKIVLGMSYYIHPGGLDALVDGLRPVFKESTDSAVNVLVRASAGPPSVRRPTQQRPDGSPVGAVGVPQVLYVPAIAWVMISLLS